MSGTNKLLVVSALLFFQFGCADGLTPEKYIRNFEKNRMKLCTTIKRNGVAATVALIPYEYYAARDVAFDSSLSVESALERYANSVFFVLSLRPDSAIVGGVLLGRGGSAGYSENIRRNSFGRERDAFLLCGKDTVWAASCNYERVWGMGDVDEFLLAFPRKKLKSGLDKYSLLIRDLVPEMGTVDIRVRELRKMTQKLKG